MKKPLIKIAVLGTRGFPGVQGGVETHCEMLYTQLAEHGCEITVFTRVPYVDSEPRSYKGVSLIPLRGPGNKYLEAVVHTFKGVLYARRLKPDILHIHAIGPSLFAPLARLLGMKVVVTTQGPDYERKKWNAFAKLFLKLCERMGMSFADEIIAVAENISCDIKRKYGRNTHVIPNGVDIPSILRTAGILEKFNLQQKRYILAVGRFVPEKGFDYLIDAFNSINIPDMKLVIAGSADHEDKYSRELRAKAEKNNNIVLTGFLTGRPLHELFAHARLFIMPSYYEGLPLALLEAMSYGLSCIVSDIPANRNVALSEDRFFRAGDTEELADRIREYAGKPWGDEEIKEQVAAIAEKYSWGKIAERTLEVYRAALGF